MLTVQEINHQLDNFNRRRKVRHIPSGFVGHLNGLHYALDSEEGEVFLSWFGKTIEVPSTELEWANSDPMSTSRHPDTIS